MRSSDDFRMIRETKVVVGTEIQNMADTAIIAHVNCGLLWTGNEAFRLE